MLKKGNIFQMKSKEQAFGIALIIIIVGSLSFGIGASYKPLIYKIFNDYEEECYEYEWYDSPSCSGYWTSIGYEHINGSWYEVNLTTPVCKCGAWYPPDGCLGTISLPNKSICLKYHLVRRVVEDNVVFTYTISVLDYDFIGFNMDDGARPVFNSREKQDVLNNTEEIVIEGNNVTITWIFDKAYSCTVVDYYLNKTGEMIDIISISQPQLEPCMAIVGFDAVQINLTLNKGKYIINLRDTWEGEIFSSKTIKIR